MILLLEPRPEISQSYCERCGITVRASVDPGKRASHYFRFPTSTTSEGGGYGPEDADRGRQLNGGPVLKSAYHDGRHLLSALEPLNGDSARTGAFFRPLHSNVGGANPSPRSFTNQRRG